jgi:hypothetical protein
MSQMGYDDYGINHEPKAFKEVYRVPVPLTRTPTTRKKKKKKKSETYL